LDVTSDSPLKMSSTGANSGDAPVRMDARTRKTLRSVGRYLAPLVRCYRTRDRTVLDDLPAFIAGRQLHTFALDSRAMISEMDLLAADAVPMNTLTRELLAALRSYFADLDGVLVIEPPSFGLSPRQLDVRCIAFGPEIEAFGGRIEAVLAAG
jgi:hypothetical protein